MPPLQRQSALRAPLLMLLLLLVGCSQLPGQSPYPIQTPESAHGSDPCSIWLRQLDQRIQARGRDPLGTPIAPYPYLRTDRLLASFSTQLDSPARRDAWYQRLYQLGQQAREAEFDTLSPPLRVQSRARAERCIQRRAAADRQTELFFTRLIANAQVADRYSNWQRFLGLFPLTRKIVLQRIRLQQQRWREAFNSPQLFQGPSHRYSPPPSPPLNPAQIAAWLEEARSTSPLGIPQLDSTRQQALFAHFAPAFEPFQASPADRIGSPYWQDGSPAVDSRDPAVYLLPSYTRFNGQILLQLNYLVWFPERPAQRPLDLYSGLLDGLLWRVTLDSDGRVLLYDSIHPCGCYHQLFPVSRRLKTKPLATDVEQPLILAGVAPERELGRLWLRLTPGDHQLLGIAWGSPPSATDRNVGSSVYRFSSYQQLRRLPAADGRRNLFDPDGLVGQSARLERFVLWPMGVASPGAMRVWGTHAISFANRRHFDDPRLFEQFFEQVPE